MIDKEKILVKIDELNGYLEELDRLKPLEFEEYNGSFKNRRTAERLLQISIEVVIDICNILVSNLKLGIPAEEDELFEKLQKEGILSNKLMRILKTMKGFRNILVHKYGTLDDELVFENLFKLEDFTNFREEIIKFVNDNRKGTSKKSK